MTTNIKGGLVSIEDCKKHDGYPDPQFAPTRKVRVELTFGVPEEAENGTDDLDITADIASRKVDELLGASHRSIPTADADAAKAAYAARASGTPSKPPATGKRRSTSAFPPTAPAPTPAPAPAADALDDLLGDKQEPVEETLPEVTDGDLNAAVRKRNEELKSPEKIRALIESYGEEGKKITLREVPQNLRHGFLLKLKELKA